MKKKIPNQVIKKLNVHELFTFFYIPLFFIFVADLPKGKYVYKDKIDSAKYTENVFLNGRNKHRATKQNKIKKIFLLSAPARCGRLTHKIKKTKVIVYVPIFDLFYFVVDVVEMNNFQIQ